MLGSGQDISLNAWVLLEGDPSTNPPLRPLLFLFIVSEIRSLGLVIHNLHISNGVDHRNDGTSTLNSPVYKELSSDEETSPSLFVPDIPTAGPSPRANNNNESGYDDDEFTPTSTGSTSKKSVPKKRKKDPEKPSKPRKSRVKNPLDSPSKTLVNRFKQNLGEMVRTVSESPLGGGGGSQMARVLLSIFDDC